jgi:hypothetical protein
MRRPGLTPLAVALAVALALTACGSSHVTHSTTSAGHPATGAAGLAVTPADPHPSTTIGFAFTAPQTAGRHGNQVVDYTLELTGPSGNGCVTRHEVAVPAATKGAVAHVLVAPGAVGGHWCTGSYTAAVQELARAACSSGQMCPMYVRVVGTVARARFAVSR